MNDSEVKKIRSKMKMAQALACQRSFSYFLTQAWPHIRPFTQCDWNWHLDAICDAMQAVADYRIQKLVINIPPGSAKSITVSVAYPAWRWLRDSNWGAMCGCQTQRLAKRDGYRTAELVASKWYQSIAAELFMLRELPGVPTVKTANAELVEIASGGQRIAASLKGGGTGLRASDVIVDDPLDAKKADSQAARDEAWEWITGTLLSRRDDIRTGSIIIMMQRLHEDDPCGRLEELDAGFRFLKIAQEYSNDHPCVLLDDYGVEVTRDPRTEDGELFFPKRFPREKVDDFKLGGPQKYEAQQNQRPIKAFGQIWKPHWWRFWYEPGQFPPDYDYKVGGITIRPSMWVPRPQSFNYMWQSWDLSLGSEKKKASWNCGLQLARENDENANRYVLDEERGRGGIEWVTDSIKRMHHRWPQTNARYIEAKALGGPIITVLMNSIPGLIGHTPKGSKETRMKAEQGTIAAGNVILPDPRSHKWVPDFVLECASAPAEPNDRADTLSQGLLKNREEVPQDLHFSIFRM